MANESAKSSTDRIDLVVRGGTLVDGTGAAPVAGDLAISGHRIVAVDEALSDPIDVAWGTRVEWRLRKILANSRVRVM